MPDPRAMAQGLETGPQMYRAPDLFSHLIEAWARALDPPRPTPIAPRDNTPMDYGLPPDQLVNSPAGGAFVYQPPTGPAPLPEPERLTGGYAPGYSPEDLGGVEINDLVQAVRERESGGMRDPYAAVNERSGALGFSQVLPRNVPAWSQRYYGHALSPAEYAQNPEAQEVITYGAIRDIAAKHARAGLSREEIVRRAAAEWYGGPGGARRVAAGTGNRPAPGNYPSLATYADDTLRRYQRR